MYFRYKAERFRNNEGNEITVKKPRVEIVLKKDSIRLFLNFRLVRHPLI
jgi:hypothetical protein